MEGKDDIKDLFSNKLSGFEAKVRPELWENISSQVASSSIASATTKSFSIISKTIIGLAVVATVVTINLVIIDKKENNQKKNSTKENSTTSKKIKVAKDVFKTETTIQKVLATDKIVISNGVLNTEVFTQESNPIITDTQDTNVKEIVFEKGLLQNSDLITENKTKETFGATLQEETLNIESKVLEKKGQESLIIDLPNVFTPNGDRVNDYLTVRSNGLSDFSVVVLNENSKIVYQSNDAEFIWDGVGLDGEIVITGNYIYYVTARNVEGKLISKHSTLRIESNR